MLFYYKVDQFLNIYIIYCEILYTVYACRVDIFSYLLVNIVDKRANVTGVIYNFIFMFCIKTFSCIIFQIEIQRLSQPELSIVLFQNYVNKPQVELKCKLNRIQNLNRFDFYMNIIIKKIQSLNMNFCIFWEIR